MIEMTAEANLHIYNTPEIASHYAALDYLSPCERLLFERYIRPGMAVLDLGVGAGRTTGFLSRVASHYVGVDYAPEMIKLCQSRFPGLDFVVAAASHMPMVQDCSFDAVVMAFNTIDYVIPDQSRTQCLQEVYRVLKPGGVLIFSSHNPRAILIRPAWNKDRIREVASKVIGSENLLFSPLVVGLTFAKVLLCSVAAVGRSALRALHRIPTGVFWKGEGYLLDTAHGGMLTHYWLPEQAEVELSRFRFQLRGTLGDDYPGTSCRYITDWYYYVFQKQELT